MFKYWNGMILLLGEFFWMIRRPAMAQDQAEVIIWYLKIRGLSFEFRRSVLAGCGIFFKMPPIFLHHKTGLSWLPHGRISSWNYAVTDVYLVGGLEHVQSQLTNSIIFQRGSNHQPVICVYNLRILILEYTMKLGLEYIAKLGCSWYK